MVTGVFAVVVLSDSVGAVGAVDCRSCRSCRSAVGVLSDFAVVLSYRGSKSAVIRETERKRHQSQRGACITLCGVHEPLHAL